MKLRKNLIGSYIFHKTLNKNILIEEGKEELYERLGLDVFTKRRKPKLQRNDKNTKRRNDNVRNDIDGIDNDN